VEEALPDLLVSLRGAPFAPKQSPPLLAFEGGRLLRYARNDRR